MPLAVLLLAMVCACASFSPGVLSQELVLSSSEDRCVIAAQTSEAALLARFGPAAVHRGRVHLGEGEWAPGTLLFPEDTLGKVEILWIDPEYRTAPARVQISGRASRWSVPPGISLGVALDSLERLNGAPFELAGFGWDYGGTVYSWGGGTLEELSTPSGRLFVRLAPLPDALLFLEDARAVIGEGAYRSDHPVMRKLNPRVYQLGLIFAP